MSHFALVLGTVTKTETQLLPRTGRPNTSTARTSRSRTNPPRKSKAGTEGLRTHHSALVIL